MRYTDHVVRVAKQRAWCVRWKTVVFAATVLSVLQNFQNLNTVLMSRCSG